MNILALDQSHCLPLCVSFSLSLSLSLSRSLSLSLSLSVCVCVCVCLSCSILLHSVSLDSIHVSVNCTLYLVLCPLRRLSIYKSCDYSATPDMAGMNCSDSVCVKYCNDETCSTDSNDMIQTLGRTSHNYGGLVGK